MQSPDIGDGMDIDKQKKNRPKRVVAGKKKPAPGSGKNGKATGVPDQEGSEDRLKVPKILLVAIRIKEDDESAISEITLDRRLLSVEEQNRVYGIAEDVSKPQNSNLSYTKPSRLLKSNSTDDHENESVLTESDNDEDGPPHRRKSYRSCWSGRSINTSSHQNAVSLSSSARNRWGESEAGMDADSSGPRPQPPRRIPSKDGEKNQSIHHSLPSRVTITSSCNTNHQSSPPNRTTSPKRGTVSQQKASTRVPRIIIPNSPAKKSNFTPPWNPKSSNNENNNARKPNEEKQDDIDQYHKLKEGTPEFVFVSTALHEAAYRRSEVVPTPGTSQQSSRKSNSRSKDYSDMNDWDITRTSPYDPNLVSSSDAEPKIYNQSSTSSPKKYFIPENAGNSSTTSSSRQNGDTKDIHVDLASYAARKYSSAVKPFTPKPKKYQQPLVMPMPMEKIFLVEDRSATSSNPPKKASRTSSVGIDLIIPPNESRFPGNIESEVDADDLTTDESDSDDLPSEIMAMDVKQMLSSIANEESRDRRIEILRVLTFVIRTANTSASRKQFSEGSGMDILRTLLLTETDSHGQRAVLKLALVLLTGTCEIEGATETTISFPDVEVIMEALLATMERHIRVAEIQILCCQVLCCLSSDLFEPTSVADGLDSGISVAVLAAMEAHHESVTMQEWGVRCLHSQCVHSRSANNIKRIVLMTRVGQGEGQCVSGSDVLLRVVRSCCRRRQTNVCLLEWICKLYKTLVSSDGIMELLSPATDLLRNLINIVHAQGKDVTSSVALLESALTVISKLIDIERNLSCINITDSFIVMLDTITCRDADREIVGLCCSVMSRLVSEHSFKKDKLLAVGTTRRLISVMLAYPDEMRIQEAGTRVLGCLCRGEEGFKHQLCTREAIEHVIRVWQRTSESSSSCSDLFEESICTLVVSLFASETERLRARAVRYGTLDLLAKVVHRNVANKRLQELAVIGLMNLSSGSTVDSLFDDGKNYVEIVTRAMERNESDSRLQKNGCCALSNIGLNNEKGVGLVVRCNGVSCIVSCLQNHLENPDVVGIACETLWSLSLRSVAVKRTILSTDGAVETIAKIILLHASSPSVQEQACRVLASVASSISDTNAPEAASCVSKLIDAICCNSSILPVLQCGAKFLRQVVVYAPEHADHACDTLTVLIQAMQDYRSAHAFQEDACNLLWTLSEKSPTAKARILDMEGISIVMEILDKSGCALRS
jgi:hypothetical protein